MNFLARLRAMMGIGDAMEHVAVRSRQAVIKADDEARFERLGDIAGQTDRARAHAAELDRLAIGL